MVPETIINWIQYSFPDLGIEDFVLLKDHLHKLLIDSSKGHCRVELDASSRLHLERHGWFYEKEVHQQLCG